MNKNSNEPPHVPINEEDKSIDEQCPSQINDHDGHTDGLLMERNGHFCTNRYESNFRKLYHSERSNSLVKSTLQVYNEALEETFEVRKRKLEDVVSQLIESTD